MAGLTHPILKVEELIAAYRDEMGIEMKKEDFTNPGHDVWFNIYFTITAKIMGLTNQDLMERLRTVPKDLEYASSYDKLLPNLRLMYLIRRILYETNCMNVEEFDLQCIKKPLRKSAILYLSSLLNFMRFQNMLKEDKDELSHAEKIKMDKNAILREQLQAINLKVSTREAENSELEKKIGLLRAKEAETMGKGKALTSKVENLKAKFEALEKEKEDLKKKIDKKNGVYMDLKSRLENAQMKVVQSPMRIQQSIQDHHDEHVQLQKEYEKLRTDYSLSRERVKFLSEMTEEITLVENTCKEVEATICDIKDKKQLLSKMQLEKEEYRQRLLGLERKKKQIDEMNETKRKELLDMSLNHSKKTAAMKAMINNLQIEMAKKQEAIDLYKSKEAVLAANKKELLKQKEYFEKEAKEACDKIRKKMCIHVALVESCKKTEEELEKDVDKWLSEN